MRTERTMLSAEEVRAFNSNLLANSNVSVFVRLKFDASFVVVCSRWIAMIATQCVRSVVRKYIFDA
jgi:hypothetical protein